LSGPGEGKPVPAFLNLQLHEFEGRNATDIVECTGSFELAHASVKGLPGSSEKPLCLNDAVIGFENAHHDLKYRRPVVFLRSLETAAFGPQEKPVAASRTQKLLREPEAGGPALGPGVTVPIGGR